MEVAFVEYLLTIESQDGEYMSIMMEIYIKVNMKMIEHVAMENILMVMVQCIMVIGMMICNLVLDMKYGEILHNIQGNIIMEKKTA